jgi:ribokinase
VKAALDAMGPADWLLLQNEINDLDEVIRQGADRGLKIALNLAPVDQRIKDYPLDMLDLLIVNLVEGQAVSGTSDTGVALAEKIADLLPATSVLLTEGKNGSIMIDCENRLRIETGSFDVEVVDETAAGDAFVGYFMAGLVESRELGLLLKEASAAGAVAVSRPGAATSIPQRTDIEAMLHAQSVSQEIRTL